MERIFISHFSFSIAEQTQFGTARRHACSDTRKSTHQCFLRSPQTSESSAFQLGVISCIFSQQTGSHYKRLAVISHRGSDKRCNTRCRGNVQEAWCYPGIKKKKFFFSKIQMWYWNWQLLSKLFSKKAIWLTCSAKWGQTDKSGFLKGAGTLQQAPLIALTLIHLVIIGNYLSISNVLMSPGCERQSNQELLV